MTYSIDYRKQVLSSIDNGLTVREAAAFYSLAPVLYIAGDRF